MIIDENEQSVELENDERLGREVILLDTSERRGYEVKGVLVAIRRYSSNGDEIWDAKEGGGIYSAHADFFRLL